MSSGLNSIDEKILGILQADSRKPFVDIATEIGLSESAVRRRVKNLLDSETIKRFTIELNTTNRTSAITLISVASTADSSAVSKDLMNLKGVEIIYEITGQYDIAAIISASSVIEINRCIDEVRKIEGVSDTNTVIVLKTMRQ
ncbi:MAG: HTH-type transcriptional regulator LysM [Nitrososphaeraceae archaeon]|jgi:Lrp/AsnC family transcriptional regulator, regulator for asnA, asnC and gidA|nr:HTH-type transcriptional regulator LysM [Nitrososphaeraceae archaeon]MDW0332703.1 HTH-type transcriptional regulator LysM [Nitrososphaeraceae archaeon]